MQHGMRNCVFAHVCAAVCMSSAVCSRQHSHDDVVVGRPHGNRNR